jgi:hypothetical protein
VGRLEERVLEQSWHAGQRFCDAFLFILPFLRIYKEYCTNFDAARRRLETLAQAHDSSGSGDRWRKFWHSAQQHPDCAGLGLGSFLIQPVQRIPRYILLLRELIKHTWSGHPDVADCRKALREMEDMALMVNEALHASDLSNELLTSHERFGRHIFGGLLAPHRQFITSGRLLLLPMDAMLGEGAEAAAAEAAAAEERRARTEVEANARAEAQAQADAEAPVDSTALPDEAPAQHGGTASLPLPLPLPLAPPMLLTPVIACTTQGAPAPPPMSSRGARAASTMLGRRSSSPSAPGGKSGSSGNSHAVTAKPRTVQAYLFSDLLLLTAIDEPAKKQSTVFGGGLGGLSGGGGLGGGSGSGGGKAAKAKTEKYFGHMFITCHTAVRALRSEDNAHSAFSVTDLGHLTQSGRLHAVGGNGLGADAGVALGDAAATAVEEGGEEESVAAGGGGGAGVASGSVGGAGDASMQMMQSVVEEGGEGEGVAGGVGGAQGGAGAEAIAPEGGGEPPSGAAGATLRRATSSRGLQAGLQAAQMFSGAARRVSKISGIGGSWGGGGNSSAGARGAGPGGSGGSFSPALLAVCMRASSLHEMKIWTDAFVDLARAAPLTPVAGKGALVSNVSAQSQRRERAARTTSADAPVCSGFLTKVRGA